MGRADLLSSGQRGTTVKSSQPAQRHSARLRRRARDGSVPCCACEGGVNLRAVDMRTRLDRRFDAPTDLGASLKSAHVVDSKADSKTGSKAERSAKTIIKRQSEPPIQLLASINGLLPLIIWQVLDRHKHVQLSRGIPHLVRSACVLVLATRS